MAILDRSEANAKRSARLAQLKKGPGTFVYTGGACQTEAIPTYLVTGARSPAFNANGMPVVDSSGRQIYERAGQVVRDDKGQPKLGGTPKIERHDLDVYTIRGVEFPKGKAVAVSDAGLALKLRCLSHFEEVEGKAAEVEHEHEEETKGPSRAELMKLAKERGFAVSPSMKKVDLEAMLAGVAQSEG